MLHQRYNRVALDSHAARQTWHTLYVPPTSRKKIEERRAKIEQAVDTSRGDGLVEFLASGEDVRARLFAPQDALRCVARLVDIPLTAIRDWVAGAKSVFAGLTPLTCGTVGQSVTSAIRQGKTKSVIAPQDKHLSR
ncbi:hypothetical protein JQ593_17835 [Bradyrhizobium viridifuturi]|uniref:hypothetical protein n=1 Tax=uncultured Bradyrhizobium sp. TaxID=199684 RepID=UPI001BA9A9D6|nr:hypothetical protein [uncultured Bradyrhizobium sp.]MBR1040666.1 hypothetical protein [Bradyrhizobium viridifuturi]MBR1074954.1 hypothetical protein [Bradyrhizobium viridifuturi]